MWYGGEWELYRNQNPELPCQQFFFNGREVLILKIDIYIYIGVGVHTKMIQAEAYDVLAVKPILVIKAGISQQEECIPFAIRVIFRERHSNGEGGMEGVSGMCSRELRV